MTGLLWWLESRECLLYVRTALIVLRELLIFSQPCEGNTILVPIVQMRKLSLQESIRLQKVPEPGLFPYTLTFSFMYTNSFHHHSQTEVRCHCTDKGPGAQKQETSLPGHTAGKVEDLVFPFRSLAGAWTPKQ